MCHNCQVSNNAYNHLPSATAFESDAVDDGQEEPHCIPANQHSYVTNKVLRVSGKVPTTFMQSLISSINSMGHSVTIVDDQESGESVSFS